MPLLSVITTVYNCERYLRVSIESALNQSFRDFEMIIINDGSTDSTGKIVNEYLKDTRIRYVYRSENKKIPTRRNEAINMAKGEYIAIHDGDDISEPDRFETQVRFLRNNLNYFCVGGHAKKIDENGKVIGEMDYPPGQHQDILDLVVKKCMNPMIDPTTMFRKNDFLNLGGYSTDKSIYTVPDMDLWLKAILSGRKLINLQYPVIQYRMNPNGMTSLHKQEMIRSHMFVWRKFMLEYMKQQWSSNVKSKEKTV